MFSAFDVGAFHYLVKPFSDEKFYEVLDRAREEYQESVKPCRNRTADKEDRYMIVKAKGIQTKVVLDTIIYGEVFNRKIVLHTTEGKLEYYGKMAELENRLGEDFFAYTEAIWCILNMSKNMTLPMFFWKTADSSSCQRDSFLNL